MKFRLYVYEEFSMKSFALIFTFFFSFGLTNIFAQNQFPDSRNVPNLKTDESVEKISNELLNISKSLQSLNLKLEKFAETFSSNQGLKLSERQQQILAAFEFLNRAEERLLTLQKLRIELSEKQVSIRVNIAEIEDNLRRESIDRSIAFRGSIDAEELRENRRRTLTKQMNELNAVLSEIQPSLFSTNGEISETERFLENIRRRIFPAIAREISDL